MSERLKEIKQRLKAVNELESFKNLGPTDLFFDDIDYLIKQAEQNECYKQALEKILAAKDEYYGNEYPDAVDEIARKTLEGEE